MKVAVHPMIVAAALGLLGPAALAEDEPSAEPCTDCSPTSDAPSPEDFARIEAEWQAAVVRLDTPSGSWS